MARIILVLVVLLAVGAVGRAETSAAPRQLAASNQQMICMQKCLDQYGATKKDACAIECGLTSGPALGGQQRDCGIEYRECMKACGKDKTCKSACRTARQSCI